MLQRMPNETTLQNAEAPRSLMTGIFGEKNIWKIWECCMRPPFFGVPLWFKDSNTSDLHPLFRKV